MIPLDTEISLALLHALAKDPTGYFWIQYGPTTHGSWDHKGTDYIRETTYNYRIASVSGWVLHTCPWMFPRMHRLEHDIMVAAVREDLGYPPDRVRKDMSWYTHGLEENEVARDKWWNFTP